MSRFRPGFDRLKIWGIWTVCFAFATAPDVIAGDERDNGLEGFSRAGVIQQRRLEAQFDARLHAGDLQAWLKSMSSAPNHVGSRHNKANAEFVQAQFRKWGWESRIETFDVLYPTLTSHTLEMVAPRRFVADLREPAIARDSGPTERGGAVPPYNIYGPDGDVVGELVYVNFGMPEDYETLATLGISVKDKIVIARYGGGWRGLKPKLAAEHGAIACVIYSDPSEDGFAEGDVYPKGGKRPASGVQRGSVIDASMVPGDPLTPGFAVAPGAPRLELREARTIPKIPVLPISYGNAEPLLAALEGPVAPKGWRGALALTYHTGPGPARVHLSVKSNWKLQPIYNVISSLRGSEDPDQWVVRGNHRDAWVYGAWDPLSGHVSMMAEAKAIGSIRRQGWTPKRTLVYASWDAEEPGLLGSTEWVETHLEELQRKAVVYINTDSQSRGFLEFGGSHALQRFANEVAADVIDPDTGVSVAARLRAKLQVDAYDGDDDKRMAAIAASAEDIPLSALGSGSDFTPFLAHAGIASISFAYGGQGDSDGVYHSSYDSVDHHMRFGDPSSAYGIAAAQTAGRLVLRMADAEILPYRFSGFASTVATYVKELHQLVDAKRERSEALAKLLQAGAFTLAADVRKSHVSPAAKPVVPFLNLAPLDNAAIRVRHSAMAYDEAMARIAREQFSAHPQQRAQLNVLLARSERALIDEHGLPGRPWFKHMIYAPGLLSGYSAKTIPGVREAIERARWTEAETSALRAADALNAYADLISEAARILDSGSGGGPVTTAVPEPAGCRIAALSRLRSAPTHQWAALGCSRSGAFNGHWRTLMVTRVPKLRARGAREAVALAAGLLGLSVCFWASETAFSHHSFAMFDRTKTVTLQGSVKEFQWTNPHSYILLLVGEKDQARQWLIETGAPGSLIRLDPRWKRDVIKAGDKVTVEIYPLRSGELGGMLMALTTPAGIVIGQHAPKSPEKN